MSAKIFIRIRIALHLFKLQPGEGVTRVCVGCIFTRCLSLQLVSDKPHARHYLQNESWHGQTKSSAHFKILALLKLFCQLGGDLFTKWRILQRWHTRGACLVVSCECVTMHAGLAGSQACNFWVMAKNVFPIPTWVLVPWMFEISRACLIRLRAVQRKR